MTLLELVEKVGVDNVLVDRVHIRQAKKRQAGGVALTLDVATSAVSMDDIMALGFGPRREGVRKVPLLVWIPETGWE